MADTKITQLRNLMTPLVNYFTMLNSKECSDKAVRMIEHDKKQSIINLPKIREILAQIPEEACEGITSNEASALPIPDVSNQRELLLAFMGHIYCIGEQVFTGNEDDIIDSFLSKQ